MLSSEAADVIAAHRGDAVVICTMTTIMTFGMRHRHPLNLRVAPLMGGASSIGLGIALAHPGRRVLVLDGDGSLVMQLGTLATIAEAAPPNFHHFVFNNGLLYEGGGRLPIAGAAKIDFPAMAHAAGYPATYDFQDAEGLNSALPRILDQGGPSLTRLAIKPPPTPRWSADNPHSELPDWWFTQMAEDARVVAAALTVAPS